MADWDRNTPWRQGHLLTAETAKALGIAHTDSPAVVVISHDCDLAQPKANEPNVEIIAGRFIDEPDGNYTHAKNLRKLHLRYLHGNDKAVVEILASDKHQLPKEGTAGLAGHQPLQNFQLGPDELTTLQQWLAARYRRAAFPDEFDRRFKETGLNEQFVKILKLHGTQIPAVFFDVDDGVEVNRAGPEDTYTLSIYLLYSTQSDPDVAAHDALKAKEAIETSFNELCNIGDGKWQWIELRECDVLADTAISYAQSIAFKKWQADYLSLRANPAHQLLKD